MSHPPLPPPPENSAGKPSLPPLPKPMPQLPQSLEMLESVAFAAICSCVVTNRLLMKKGLITSAEYAADLDENAKIMKETILFDRSTLNFDETIRLLKGASQSE